MNNVAPLSDEIAREAADPATPLESLASIAGRHPAARAGVAGNRSAYPGLLDWMAKDPATPADALAALAANHFGLHPVIAVHPNAYPGLREWIAVVSPDAVPALAQVPSPGIAQGSAPTPTGKPGAFVEPTASSPRSWGTYRTRMILTYSLAAFGGFVMPTLSIVSASLSSSALGYSVFGSLTLLALVGVFVVVPGDPRARLIGGAVSGFVRLIFLVLTLTPFGVNEYMTSIGAAVIVASWFFVRRRPGLSYIFVALTFIIYIGLSAIAMQVSSTLFTSGMPFETAIVVVTLVYAYIPAVSIVVPVLLGRLIATFRPAQQSVLS